ncbi:hypothetical protein GCM10009069_05580 [Algimonas arctica]|uniref:Uncharacterized protein n=1 Tax=Algimonas arctica TaxID=1479486 RepID=A0A8J3CQC2_9PROT|nr:hypothetical protein GCM10009069_05580 [Algimonas arctica]
MRRAADIFAGVQFDDGGQIGPAFIRSNIGNVSFATLVPMVGRLTPDSVSCINLKVLLYLISCDNRGLEAMLSQTVSIAVSST